MADDLNSKPPGGAGDKTNFSRPKVPAANVPRVPRESGALNSDPSRSFPIGDDCLSK